MDRDVLWQTQVQGHLTGEGLERVLPVGHLPRVPNGAGLELVILLLSHWDSICAPGLPASTIFFCSCFLKVITMESLESKKLKILDYLAQFLFETAQAT